MIVFYRMAYLNLLSHSSLDGYLDYFCLSPIMQICVIHDVEFFEHFSLFSFPVRVQKY